jgi:hypothetical protein
MAHRHSLSTNRAQPMRLVLILLTFACLHASAQITLRINGAPPVTMAAADIAKLPHHTVVLNDHGKLITYEGALLYDVLTHAGFDFGEGLRGRQLSSYVAALASDGYETVYALAEVDPTIGDSGILIADKREGERLSLDEGPLRIIVPHDKRPARSLKMLQEIDVVQLKK